MKTQVYVPHKDVVLRDEGVCIWSKLDNGEIKYKRVADYMKVTKLTENIDTDSMEITIVFNDSTEDSEDKEITVGLGEVATKTKILNLASSGLDINENNAKCVIKHIRNQREGVRKIKVHSNLGFFLKNKEYFFKAHKVIGSSKDKDIESTYIGELSIQPKGTFKEWKKLIDEHVIGRYPLELALVIGFSAPVVGFIANEIGIESPLIHIYGDSTQGKTTAAMLAVSAFGSPNIRDNGLLMTWNTTTNAMHGIISGNTGIPLVFDESSMSNTKDFTKEIYSLTSGKDKARMNKECKIKEQRVWNTTIISTGEHSIFTKSKANTGIRMRLLEFGNITWTESANQAEIIKEVVLKNYGHYGQVFARILLSLGKDKVIELHKKCKEELVIKLKESMFADRIAGKLALLMVAARILKEYIKIDLNLEEIEKLIILNETESIEDKDIADKAHDLLIQMIAENAGKFEKSVDNVRETHPAIDRETWGIIEEKGRGSNKKVTVVVIAEIFKKILKDNGFEEPKVILKKWKEKGMLDHEENKLTRRRKIAGIDKVTCYVIKLDDKENESNTPKEPDVINIKKEEAAKNSAKQEMMTEVKDGIYPFWN